MSSKEAKIVFKEVRDAIKNEKYAEAVEKCENLLKDEPGSYMAHLLLGAAYQNIDKAEAARQLRKAVVYSPAAPTVALQGLANCAPLNELPKIYEQLLELVPEKYPDYYQKLHALSENSTTRTECVGIFKREANKTEGARREMALKHLVEIVVSNDLQITAVDEQLFKTALEQIISDVQLVAPVVYLKAYKRYLKLLYNQNDLLNCIKHADVVAELCPNDIYAYEWICRIYWQHYKSISPAEWTEQLKEPIMHYAEKLLQLSENSSSALLVKAIVLYEVHRQHVAGRDLLYRVLKLEPKNVVAVELLARIETELGAFGKALPLWKQLGEQCELQYAVCLSHEKEVERLQEAVTLLEKTESTDEEIRHALVRCYAKLNMLNKVSTLSSDHVIKAKYLLSPKEAVDYLLANANLEAFNELLALGKLHLKMGNYPDALTCMLNVTKLKPHRSECFYYLGKIYYATNDIVRARKCFEKCINLNPLFEEAVNNLSAIYQQTGQEDLNVALLLNTLKHMKSEGSKRVHYKLGLHWLNVKKWDEAIQSFRTAIKLEAGCMIYWESLGDAYSERGSYNSAIRVFQKILEMDPGNIYAKLQIALIKTTIRMYNEAIEDFDSLLQAHPDYLPGLKGAAEAHIGLSNNLKLEHRYGRCKIHLQLALNHLQRVFITREDLNMVWVWRLTANVFVQTAQMSTSLANLDVSGKLAKRETETIFLNRKDLLNLATRFYTCALKLKQNTYLWYDLAVCSYYSAVHMPEEAQTHLELAVQACKMALMEQSNRWQNWNLYGVINLHEAIDNLPLAQHCFIQALMLERKSYATWTNLGVLYLKLKDIRLANQAFKRSQQSSPIYQNAWIGQAMIAETIGEEEEALDLFRHCQQFEYHPESALGYAHWVCAVLSDPDKCQQPHYKHAINHMYADVVALDAINWHNLNEEEKASAAAWCFQGYLCERQKLYTSAVKAYKQASDKAAAGVERDKMLTNLGYVYLKSKNPNEAIKVFNMVAQATFKPIIGLALSYFRAGQYQESYSVYNSVLKSVVDSENDKAANILVAMAAMVFASQGEADTKTILYQCILLKDYPIQVLYSACAVGIIHHDLELTATILTELKKYEDMEQHCAHIAFLTAQQKVAIKQPMKGLRYLVSRVHVYPHLPELRKVLANFLLDYFADDPAYHQATTQEALSAIDLVHRSSSIKSDCTEDAQTLLIASRALLPVDKHRSRILAERAVHLHPQNGDARTALLNVC